MASALRASSRVGCLMGAIDNRERDFIQRYNRLYRRPCMLAAWLSKLATWLKNR